MLRPGQAIALCVIALLLIGVVMVNSAGMSVDPRRAVTAESILLSRSTVYMGLAVVAMVGVGLMPIRRLARRFEPAGVEAEAASPAPAVADSPESPQWGPWRAVTAWLAGIRGLWPLWLSCAALVGILACVYLPGIGKEVNHSHRWVNLHLPGLDSLQPSEIAKWGLILVVAWYGCRQGARMRRFWTGLIPGLAAAGLVAGVIVVEDLGTGALVGMVACLLLIAAGARIWHLLLLAPIPLAGVVLAIITSPYRMHRIMSFLNPYEDPQGKGYHMIQSMLAVANGKFFGRGLGHGLQKFGYLPEDTTDFLFAIVCEELGVFGAATIIFLYAGLLYSLLTVIRREPSRLLKLIGLGVTATIGLQALINLAVVTGLGPTKGIALPLLSSGGTGWILTAASLGLVIAMDRTQDMMQWYRVPSEGVAPSDEDQLETEDAAESEGDAGSAGDERFAPPVVMATAAAVVAGATTSETAPPPVGQLPLITATPADEPSPVVYPLVSEAEPTRETASAAVVVDQPAAVSGEPGMLFDLDPAAPASLDARSPAPPAAPAPTVVVTDNARDWPDNARLSPA